MRTVFPAHFRPTESELTRLWSTAIFAVDANVLLHLYRYSPQAREALEKALLSVKGRIFLPHQAAREFLKNRAGVITDQSGQYTSAIEGITSLLAKLKDRKRHPFVSDAVLEKFEGLDGELRSDLSAKRDELLARLTNDERLDFIESLFEGRTGKPFDESALNDLLKEAEDRYSRKVPPGYKDANKSSEDDASRKYGDFLVWRQLIDNANEQQRPLILVSDDAKEDWWSIQSGRTIGPRVELREEFMLATGQDFWMYGVDTFLEHSAKVANTTVSEAVIAEVVQVSGEVNSVTRRHTQFRHISEEEILERLRFSERWASEHEGFVGLHSFVRNFLGDMGFDYASSYEALENLVERGLVETYEHKGENHHRPVVAIRAAGPRQAPYLNSLRSFMQKYNQLLDSSPETES
jgi:DNA polymerase IIIc chi subunit